jgi:hypothetical protein
MRTRQIFHIFALLLWFTCIQCAPARRYVSIRLPPMYGYAADGLEWNIQWWDGGEVREKSIRLSYGSPLPSRSLDLKLAIQPHGIHVPVIMAVPRMELSRTSIPLSPFGALMTTPAEETIELIRREGEIARVVLRLASKGVDPGQINLERLRFSVRQRSRNWPNRLRTLDEDRLGAALMGGTMRVSDVAFLPAPLHRIATPLIDVPKTGDVWFTDEPGAPVIRGQSTDEESRMAIAVAPGEVRRLWRRSSTDGWELLVVHRAPGGNSWHHRFIESPD